MLAELILIEARNPQLFAHLLARLPLACLAITSAIALTLLSEPILVSEPADGDPDVLTGRERGAWNSNRDERWLLSRPDGWYGSRQSSSRHRDKFQPRYRDDFED